MGRRSQDVNTVPSGSKAQWNCNMTVKGMRSEASLLRLALVFISYYLCSCSFSVKLKFFQIQNKKEQLSTITQQYSGHWQEVTKSSPHPKRWDCTKVWMPGNERHWEPYQRLSASLSSGPQWLMTLSHAKHIHSFPGSSKLSPHYTVKDWNHLSQV